LKKIIGIVVPIVAVLALLVTAVPAFAATSSTSVTTGVTVISGNGIAPLVKCKWETTLTPAGISSDNYESGDPAHATPLTQVADTIGFQAQTRVDFWAVVSDNAGAQNMKIV